MVNGGGEVELVKHEFQPQIIENLQGCRIICLSVPFPPQLTGYANSGFTTLFFFWQPNSIRNSFLSLSLSLSLSLFLSCSHGLGMDSLVQT